MIDPSSLTVVVNCFNSQSTLPLTLHYLVNSSFAFDILVVDNCSTDATCNIASKYASHYLYITLLSTSTHMSLGEARNFALSHVKSTYIGFVDSDDLVSLDRFDLQISLMQHFNAMISFTNSFSLDSKFRVVKLPGYGNSPRLLSTDDLIKHYHPSLSSILFNTSWLINNLQSPIFDPSYSFLEEYDVMIRASVHTPVLYIPTYLVYWFINPGGLTSLHSDQFLSERKKLYTSYSSSSLLNYSQLSLIKSEIDRESCLLLIKSNSFLEAFRTYHFFSLFMLFKVVFKSIFPGLYRLLYFIKS